MVEICSWNDEINQHNNDGLLDSHSLSEIKEILELNLEVMYFSISDYDQLEVLLRDSNLYYAETESKEMIERKISRDPESIIVVKNNNEIIWCVFVVDSGNEVILSRLWVLGTYRKRWIWDILVKKVIDLAKKRWIKKITLFVWEAKESLQKYYEKLWFELWNTYRTWKYFL